MSPRLAPSQSRSAPLPLDSSQLPTPKPANLPTRTRSKPSKMTLQLHLWPRNVPDMMVSSVLSTIHALTSTTGIPPFPFESSPSSMLRSLYFAPILFAIPGDRTPNLTTITVTTNYYTPILCNAPGLDSRTASWLSTSCLPHARSFTMHITQPRI